MALRIHNTYTRKKEEFVPLDPEGKRVNFYSCGPTVYDYFHIGNARPLIVFDMFRRYLEYKGYDVNYIVNITDIDDKIIKRANEEGIDYKTVAAKYSEAFFDGCEKLGVRPATVHPCATDHIGDMIKLVKDLVEKGHAYEADGDVYFDIASFKGYGKLSGRDIEHMQAGARIDIDDRKRNPLDFALWKASKPGEPSWDSPWGPGRPGWHIECSVMSMNFAGDTLDIHAGGQDLIFPHHENETAQSEAATGKPFARYWMHNGFLDIEGEKMSKSLGNFLTVRDILKQFDPMALRMFFILKHYRSPIDFSRERIEEAQAAFNRLKNAYEKIARALKDHDKADEAGDTSQVEDFTDIVKLKMAIEEALDDDFNTAKAMGHFFEIAKIVNSLDDDHSHAYTVMTKAKEIFDEIGQEIFGLTFEKPVEQQGLADDLMNLLINLRAAARKEKNFSLGDAIRDQLKEIGITLEDRPDGTSWKVE